MPIAIKLGEAMFRQVVRVGVIMLCLMMPVQAAPAEPVNLTLASIHDVITPPLPLSHEDLLWLANKRVLTLGVYGTESPPLSMNSATGRYRGMNADYLLLMKNALRIGLAIKSYPDKQQAFDALKAGHIDLILTPPTGAGPLKPPFISTLPLVRGYPTLVTRQAEVMKPLYERDEEVSIAVSERYPADDFIKMAFPKARIKTYPEDYLALASVANKQNDYFFGNNLTTSFLIARDFYQTLGMVKFWREPQTATAFVALNSQRNLVTIVDTFISSLTEPMHNQIAQSWIELGNLALLSEALKLTPKEKRWLERHQTLRVLINPYYAPFSMVDENQDIRGLIGDVLNLIHLQTGITFDPIIANSNGEMVDIIRKGEWDIIPFATYSPEREDEIAFTHPFIATPFVVVTQATPDGIIEIKPGMRVALPAYHTLSEKLQRKHPDIEWVRAENTSDALSMLNQGKIDAVISTQLATRFIIDHYYPDQLFYSRIPDEPPAQITFAMPRGATELQGIMNKALDDIPPKEMLDLAGKWMKMPEVKIGTWDLYSRPFYWVVGLAMLLILSSLLWGAYLLRAVRRKRASQAALKYQLSFRQTLFNAIPVPVYVVRTDGELDSYNHAFDTFFSAGQHEALQFSLFDRRHPLAEIFPAVYREIQQGLTPDTVIPHQLVLHNGEEERLILHWMTLCRLPADMPPTLICGWQDITESRQLMRELQIEKDKAIEASQAKSTFLANMSHEIRTPVSAIMGFLELMNTRKQTPEENQQSIQLAYATAQSLIGLIGDVLDMEKIESGKFELAPEWVDADALIGTTIGNFDGLATQKKIYLTVHSHLAKGLSLWLDPQAVKQVLANLIGNAIKFTQQGGVDVCAETQALDDGQIRLTLRVKDSGVGISEQEQEQLFQPFSQAKSGKRQNGSGLGLAICRELVERMGGRIEMRSQPGRGTVVTFTLTAAVSAQVTPVSVLANNIEEPAKALRILIADDQPTNRLLLRRQLDTLGYYVDEAIDGVEALTLIGQRAYDLLITDLNMPNMDGITLTRRVREEGRQMVIWGLTANAQADERERCLAAGMNLCLFKPVDLPQLKAALREIDKPFQDIALGELIDMTTLNTLSLGDTKLMRQMLEQSRVENSKDIEAARDAIADRDWTRVQRYLHRINGTAQILGATAIHTLAEQLENALAKGQHEPIIESGIAELEQRLAALSAAIEVFSTGE